MKTIKRTCKNNTTKKTQCEICNKIVYGGSFKYKIHLYQHNAIEPRFKCTYCNKEYFRYDFYKKHLAVHNGVRRYYICDYCERGFVDKRNLINHLRIHDEHQSSHYKCMACGAKYCEERLLKYHIRKQHYNLNGTTTTYENRKPNETWVERVMDSEVFVQITKLDNNAIIIEKCPTTIKVGSPKKKEKSEFQNYMSSVFAKVDMSHYSKAICDYCNKQMLKKSLISHIRERHLKIKRFKCDVCNSSFSRHYMLVNHKCGQFKTRERKLVYYP